MCSVVFLRIDLDRTVGPCFDPGAGDAIAAPSASPAVAVNTGTFFNSREVRPTSVPREAGNGRWLEARAQKGGIVYPLEAFFLRYLSSSDELVGAISFF